MNLLILAGILAIAQAPSPPQPIPRNTSQIRQEVHSDASKAAPSPEPLVSRDPAMAEGNHLVPKIKEWSVKEWSDAVIAIFTIVLAGVGFLQWRVLRMHSKELESVAAAAKDNAEAASQNAIAALKNAQATKEIVEIFTKKERARLLIEPDYPDYSNFYAILQPSQVVEVAIKITQSGPTRAYNVKGEFKVIVTPSKEPPEMDGMLPMSIPNQIVADSEPIVERAAIELNYSEVEAIKAEQSFVHFFGFATYDDVFERPHKTSFRYRWKRELIELGEESQTEYDDGWETLHYQET